MKKVIIYIDGSNFYFSVKKRFNQNIDIGKLCKKLSEGHDLIKINYYIAPIGESNPEMYSKQQKFFEKLRKVPKLNIVFGRLEKRKRDGKTYYVEKATDVNLALDLVLDAQSNDYDLAFLISNDGDFSGAATAAIQRFKKKIVYVAIGNQKSISYHLKKVSTKTQNLGEDFVRDILVSK